MSTARHPQTKAQRRLGAPPDGGEVVQVGQPLDSVPDHHPLEYRNRRNAAIAAFSLLVAIGGGWKLYDSLNPDVPSLGSAIGSGSSGGETGGGGASTAAYVDMCSRIPRSVVAQLIKYPESPTGLVCGSSEEVLGDWQGGVVYAQTYSARLTLTDYEPMLNKSDAVPLPGGGVWSNSADMIERRVTFQGHRMYLGVVCNDDPAKGGLGPTDFPRLAGAFLDQVQQNLNSTG